MVKLGRFWILVQDVFAFWIQPIAAFVALVSGSFLTFEFEKLRKAHPTWSGPIDWIESAVPFLFFIAAAMTLIASIILSIRGRSIRKLNSQLNSQKSQIDEIGNVIVILFDGLMLNLANKLELDQGSQVRLSLYVHDSALQAFIPCGRYSRNPEFNRPGRTSYPDSEGCIAAGWKKGWHFDNQVPPAGQAGRRRDHNQRQYGMPGYVTDEIRMKSTAYAVRRLDNLEGKAIAVLVIEAIDPNFFTESDLRDTINGSINDYARVIHQLRAYVPNPAQAAESGL